MINVAKALFVQAARRKWTIDVMYDDEAGYTGTNASEAWRAVTDVHDDVFVHFHDADGHHVGWVRVCAYGLEPDETIIDGSAVGPVADLSDAITESVHT
jgi:hypothetical protein